MRTLKIFGVADGEKIEAMDLNGKIASILRTANSISLEKLH